MKTAWLQKFNRLPGYMRFQAFYVQVEVVKEEDRTVEYNYQERKDVPQAGGGFLSEYGPVEIRTKVEKWTQIREKGKLKWVESHKLFEEKPVK